MLVTPYTRELRDFNKPSAIRVYSCARNTTTRRLSGSWKPRSSLERSNFVSSRKEVATPSAEVLKTTCGSWAKRLFYTLTLSHSSLSQCVMVMGNWTTRTMTWFKAHGWDWIENISVIYRLLFKDGLRDLGIVSWLVKRFYPNTTSKQAFDL